MLGDSVQNDVKAGRAGIKLQGPSHSAQFPPMLSLIVLLVLVDATSDMQSSR